MICTPWKRGDTEGQCEGQNQKTVVDEVEYREGADHEDNKEPNFAKL